MTTRCQFALLLLAMPFAARAQQPMSADSARGACVPRWHPRCSTPGVALALKEVGREKIKGRTEVTYQLAPSGFPHGANLTLWGWEAGGEPHAMITGFTVDSTGAVCYAGGCEGIKLPVSGFSPGEPLRSAFIATDETVRAYAVAYPFPLQAVAQGCRLNVELIHKDAFSVWGEGFDPGENLHTVSRSGDEVLSPDTLTVDPDSSTLGHTLIVSPGVKGKRGGVATYTFVGRRCRVEVTYPWGNALKPQ